MAYLNDIYIFVKDESIDRSMEVTDHPVEQGIDISDNVSRNADILNISGEIVGENASTDLSSITNIMRNGELVKYYGRNIVTNAVILSFKTGHPNTIWGGCSFDMQIKTIRIANSCYTKNNAGTQQVEKNSNNQTVRHIVKDVDTYANLIGNADSPYHRYGMSFNDFINVNSPGGVRSEIGEDGKKHFYLKPGKSIIVGYNTVNYTVFKNVQEAYDDFKANKTTRLAEIEERKKKAQDDFEKQLKEGKEATWLY
jgi:hypothetical protein